MPKELLEIRNFNVGTVSTPSEEDIPLEAASHSLDVDPNSLDANLKGRNDDTIDATAPNSGSLPRIDKCATIKDLSGKDELILFDETSTKKWKSWNDYGSNADTVSDVLIQPTVDSSEIAMAVNNKEVHVGQGHNSSFNPKWIGYLNHKQFGTSTTSIYQTNSECSRPLQTGGFDGIIVDDEYIYTFKRNSDYIAKWNKSTKALEGQTTDPLLQITAFCFDEPTTWDPTGDYIWAWCQGLGKFGGLVKIDKGSLNPVHYWYPKGDPYSGVNGLDLNVLAGCWDDDAILNPLGYSKSFGSDTNIDGQYVSQILQTQNYIWLAVHNSARRSNIQDGVLWRFPRPTDLSADTITLTQADPIKKRWNTNDANWANDDFLGIYGTGQLSPVNAYCKLVQTGSSTAAQTNTPYDRSIVYENRRLFWKTIEQPLCRSNADSDEIIYFFDGIKGDVTETSSPAWDISSGSLYASSLGSGSPTTGFVNYVYNSSTSGVAGSTFAITAHTAHCEKNKMGAFIVKETHFTGYATTPSSYTSIYIGSPPCSLGHIRNAANNDGPFLYESKSLMNISHAEGTGTGKVYASIATDSNNTEIWEIPVDTNGCSHAVMTAANTAASQNLYLWKGFQSSAGSTITAIEDGCSLSSIKGFVATRKDTAVSASEPINFATTVGFAGFLSIDTIADTTETYNSAMDVFLNVTHENLINDQFSGTKTFRYKTSFLYDGYQESPISADYTEIVGQGKNIKIDITAKTTSLFNKRVSHLNLYRAEYITGNVETLSMYRLVKSLELDTNWVDTTLPSNFGTGKLRSVFDNYIVSSTFDSNAGFSQALTTTTAAWKVSAVLNNTHFIGNCKHSLIEDASNYLFKSRPYMFDTFDFTQDFLVLPDTPNALVAYNGRLFAFCDNQTFQIDPNTFYVEDTIEGIGCAGPNAFKVTDYGLCVADKNNIYLNAGQGFNAISQIINISENGTGYQELFSNTYPFPLIRFDSKRNCFLIIMSKDRCWSYNISQNRWDLWSITLTGTNDLYYAFEDSNGVVNLSVQNNGANATLTIGTSASTKDFTWESKKIILNASTQDKMFYKADKIGTADITSSPDISSSSAKSKTLQLTATGNANGEYIDSIGIVFRRLKVK